MHRCERPKFTHTDKIDLKRQTANYQAVNQGQNQDSPQRRYRNALAWILYNFEYSPSSLINSSCVPNSATVPSFMHLSTNSRSDRRIAKDENANMKNSQYNIGEFREVGKAMRHEYHGLPLSSL